VIGPASGRLGARAGAKRFGTYESARRTCRRRPLNEAVGKNKISDAGRIDRSGRQRQNLRRRSLGYPRAGAKRSAGTNLPGELADAVASTERSAQTILPTPSLRRSGRHKMSQRQGGDCLTELGDSDQRRLSVGGAITHFRSRSLREASDTRKEARGYAATVGFRRASCLAPVASTKAVGTDERQHSLRKELPRSSLEERGDDRVS
jgi:hypothetical protein